MYLFLCFSSLAMVLTKHVYLRRKKYKMHMIQDAPTAMGVSLWCYFVHAHHPWNQKKRHRSSEAVLVWALAVLRRRTTLICNLLALAEPGYTPAVSTSAMPVPSRSPFTPSPKVSRRWPWTSSSGTEAAYRNATHRARPRLQALSPPFRQREHCMTECM